MSSAECSTAESSIEVAPPRGDGQKSNTTYLEEEVRGHLGHLADDVVVRRHLGLLGVGGVGLASILLPAAVTAANDPLDLHVFDTVSTEPEKYREKKRETPAPKRVSRFRAAPREERADWG